MMMNSLIRSVRDLAAMHRIANDDAPKTTTSPTSAYYLLASQVMMAKEDIMPARLSHGTHADCSGSWRMIALVGARPRPAILKRGGCEGPRRWRPSGPVAGSTGRAMGAARVRWRAPPARLYRRFSRAPASSPRDGHGRRPTSRRVFRAVCTLVTPSAASPTVALLSGAQAVCSRCHALRAPPGPARPTIMRQRCTFNQNCQLRSRPTQP